jgi:hypothetical protein
MKSEDLSIGTNRASLVLTIDYRCDDERKKKKVVYTGYLVYTGRTRPAGASLEGRRKSEAKFSSPLLEPSSHGGN